MGVFKLTGYRQNSESRKLKTSNSPLGEHDSMSGSGISLKDTGNMAVGTPCRPLTGPPESPVAGRTHGSFDRERGAPCLRLLTYLDNEQNWALSKSNYALGRSIVLHLVFAALLLLVPSAIPVTPVDPPSICIGICSVPSIIQSKQQAIQMEKSNIVHSEPTMPRVHPCGQARSSANNSFPTIANQPLLSETRQTKHTLFGNVLKDLTAGKGRLSSGSAAIGDGWKQRSGYGAAMVAAATTGNRKGTDPPVGLAPRASNGGRKVALHTPQSRSSKRSNLHIRDMAQTLKELSFWGVARNQPGAAACIFRFNGLGPIRSTCIPLSLPARQYGISPTNVAYDPDENAFYGVTSNRLTNWKEMGGSLIRQDVNRRTALIKSTAPCDLNSICSITYDTKRKRLLVSGNDSKFEPGLFEYIPKTSRWSVLENTGPWQGKGDAQRHCAYWGEHGRVSALYYDASLDRIFGAPYNENGDGIGSIVQMTPTGQWEKTICLDPPTTELIGTDGSQLKIQGRLAIITTPLNAGGLDNEVFAGPPSDAAAKIYVYDFPSGKLLRTSLMKFQN